MNNSINDYIDICIGSNGSHYDVSKVVYELIKDKMKYIGKNNWKYNNNGIYEFDDKNNNYLKNEIKSNIINTFIIRSSYWDDKANIENDINLVMDYKLKSFILLQIEGKLKETKYIICIIKELKQFFTDNIE